MSFLRRLGGLRLSGKMMLFFVALVLSQSFISLSILTAIISRTNLEALQARMGYTLLAVEGYLQETFRDLRVKAELIAGQKKTIEYTDFGLKTMLARELTVFRESLGIESLTVFTNPDYPFARTRRLEADDALLRGELAQAFQGSGRLFVARNGADPGLYILSPIRRGEVIIGVLSLGLRVDRSFIDRIEKVSGSGVVLRFEGTSVHGGALSEGGVERIINDYARRSPAGERIAMASGHIVGAIDLARLGLPGGTIYCLLDTAESTRLIRRYNLISLVSTCLILSLALVSGIVFYQRTFLRRFQVILGGIGRISGGDFHPPFRLDWQDEFGQLANAFDDMCGKLLVREKELKSLEEKLALSSKLAALGEMAAGVAHQIRNPLMVMKVSAEMLRDSYTVHEDPERYQKLTSLVVDEADTLNLVVSNFLDFARPRPVLRVPCPIAGVIDFCLDGLPLEKFHGITVRRVVPEGLPEYAMDRNLVTQALSNLILNALQASRNGSCVEVRARLDGGKLCMEVQDRGEGMDEETKRSIFNPFFTTRVSGTGLGLSIVHRIVEGHGGTIEVRSAPGEGSTFTMVI